MGMGTELEGREMDPWSMTKRGNNPNSPGKVYARENPVKAIAIGVAFFAPAAILAVGPEAAGAIVLNEVKDEVLSQATGGASDVLDITKNVKNLAEMGVEKLLKTELDVGTYDELIKVGTKGDNITPHHMPANDFMNSKGVSKGEGVTMNMEQPTPGKGGRHRKTSSYGKKSDKSLSGRTSLARDIKDARNIYRSERILTQKVNDGLQQVIKLNKKKFPKLFKKE